MIARMGQIAQRIHAFVQSQSPLRAAMVSTDIVISVYQRDFSLFLAPQFMA